MTDAVTIYRVIRIEEFLGFYVKVVFVVRKDFFFFYTCMHNSFRHIVNIQKK